jgi:hypothetical protein
MLTKLLRLFSSGPNIEDLHDFYAKRGRLDEHAHVRATYKVRIDAPVDVVWGHLADIARWPDWSAGISDVRLPHGVALDRPFHWRNGIHRIDSRIAVLATEREISWTGVCGGFLAKAVHRQLLAADGDGTWVTAEESMSGPLLPLYYSDAKLRESLVSWMAELQQAAETTRSTAPRAHAAAAQDQL